MVRPRCASCLITVARKPATQRTTLALAVAVAHSRPDRIARPPGGSILSPPMRFLVSAILAFAVLLPAAVPAQARVPDGWLGVTLDGPFETGDGREWDRIAAAGADTVRTAMRWYHFQPYRTASDVPPSERPRFRDVEGVPTDFSHMDALVAAAARRGLTVLPVVHAAPAWAVSRPEQDGSRPRDPATFARFMTALVGRYGPRGSLWAERPDLPQVPIRAWQIWNEPNLTQYWSKQPFARSFLRMLRSASAAVRAADRGATVVLAGLTNKSWRALRSVYRAGGRGQFDAVALHPFTRKPADVVRLIRLARGVMRRYGDRRLPVWITELSWPAAEGKVGRRNRTGFEVTDKMQARNLGVVLRLLARERKRLRIERVVWYTWLSEETGSNPFNWSGLRRVRKGSVVNTPALRAFRRAARSLIR
jgi:hypothetical protein